ncbi:hypothetical protein Tco_0565178 [Tanacetum coccineum]
MSENEMRPLCNSQCLRSKMRPLYNSQCLSCERALVLDRAVQRRRALEGVVGGISLTSTYKVGQRSRSMPEKEGAERISAFRRSPHPVHGFTIIPYGLLPSLLFASPVATPSATISVEED